MGLSDCTVQALLDVSDLDRAKRFYEQQLGLVPREEEEEAVRYPCADGTRDRRLSLTRERRQVAGDARGLVRR